MKTLRMIAASAVVVLAVACTSSNGGNGSAALADSLKTVNPVNPNELLPKKSLVDSVSYYLGLNYGPMFKQYDFGELNMKLVYKGLEDFINAKGEMSDSTFAKQFKYNPEDMSAAINKLLSQRSEYKLAVNSRKEEEFLASNARKEGVVVSESGLQYIIHEEGNEVKPDAMDTVFAHYKGTLLDGKVFDEVPADQPSAQFSLNRVIKGWTEGLSKIGEGGKITLYVPARLGYGERGTRGIDPNATLIFEVQLDSVKRYVAPEAK